MSQGPTRTPASEGPSAAPTRSRVLDATSPLLRRAHSYAEDYLGSLDDRPVAPDRSTVLRLEALGGELPERPRDPTETLALLHEHGSPATVAQTGGRYFGFVNGATLPVGLAARWLADAWDQNTAHYVMSPVALHLEDVCETWLVDLLGLPRETAAGFVTGTMIANLSGLAAGRNELLRRAGHDVARDGLLGAPKLEVVVGEGAHAAIAKSLSLLGLGSASATVVPQDEHGAMRLDALPELDELTLLALQVGNVSTGAADPIAEICERARRAGAWTHVDGAFGLWAAASRRHRHLCDGIDLADSWALDAHKTLNAPYDSGIVLCRDRGALARAFEASADYFQWSERRDGMAYTPSMSKRARAVELWAILRTLGRRGVEELVDQLCAHARTLAERLAREGFQVHNDVVFNQVLISCDDDQTTSATLERAQESGELWCGGTTFRGRSMIRLSVCSWVTDEGDLDRAVACLVASREASRSR